MRTRWPRRRGRHPVDLFRVARRTACLGLTAGLALTACSGAPGHGPAPPEGFTEVRAGGLAYGVPAGWVAVEPPSERAEAWEGLHELRDGDRPVAEVGVITAFGDVADARELAFESLSLVRFETRAAPPQRDPGFEVPGAADSERGDYHYEHPDGRSGQVRGVDIAVVLEGGDGVVLRLTGLTDHLGEEELEEIVSSVRVPG
ncbi:hypothetical protein ACQEU5_14765 [Marinactinospora thermotolerans]|uniref:Lipoprotein LpqN n=1 Tax=Marinactinospora thermotolerans DSM 45154 TaxID=1122192 RepID=A0A1T4RPP6_9ACTN|nr:hypothetical protein [Marinactinospora thermotolerans]SKA17847.1 hypothetical protein SAMN02745673_02863 [Marinactinospora thermotolerans DSM 45154]